MFISTKTFGISFFWALALLYVSHAHAGIMNNTVVFSHNIQVHHQGINNLEMVVTYRRMPGVPITINAKAYTATIDSVFDHYPNTTDWWEIVNKNLTSVLMQKYPDVDSLASDILVNWVSGAGYDYGHRDPTRSVTARTRAGKLYEYFGFKTLPGFTMVFKGKKKKVNLDLLYQYNNHLADKDYPDELEAERYYKKLISDNAPSASDLGTLNNMVATEMLKKYTLTQAIHSDIKIMQGKRAKIQSDLIKRR